MNGGTSKWLVLATVIIGTFLGRLDQTIVNLALPKIIGDFSLTVTTAAWIATAYIIANAVFVPVWGKLGDTAGRKKIYILGFAIFIVGSLLAGFAWNFSSLIVFRIIQAVASSADYPTAMAILTVTFAPGRERAQALGIWSSAFAASAVFGPLIGGPLIDTFGWRSIFFLNIPVGLVGLVMAWVFIHESVSEHKTVKFDWLGAGTLGMVLSTLVLVLDRGLDWGWLSLNSILCYAVAALFAVIFYYIERTHEEPIIDFKFFQNWIFVNALSNNFIIFLCLMGNIFLLPLFAQTFLGFSATQSGYLFIPMGIAIPLAAALGGRFVGKIESRYIIFISTVLAAAGFYFLSYIDPKSTAIDIMIPLGVMSFGMGLGMAQRTNIIASIVPAQEIGIASAILALVRNIGGAFGIAIFGTILQTIEKAKILSMGANSVINSTNPAVIQQGIALIELKAQVGAYAEVFSIGALIMFLGAFPILWMKIRRNMAGETVHIIN